MVLLEELWSYEGTLGHMRGLVFLLGELWSYGGLDVLDEGNCGPMRGLRHLR